MADRPEWHDSYWKKMDKETEKKLRTACPHCGSDKTYYNKQFHVWRCGKCEGSFTVKGYGDNKPWWKRIWGK
jgi:ribosomal protein L37AE/L43A